MKGPQLVILFSAILVMGAGAYISFVQDKPIGAVFLGTGATLAAASTMIGAAAKAKNKKEDVDAG